MLKYSELFHSGKETSSKWEERKPAKINIWIEYSYDIFDCSLRVLIQTYSVRKQATKVVYHTFSSQLSAFISHFKYLASLSDNYTPGRLMGKWFLLRCEEVSLEKVFETMFPRCSSYTNHRINWCYRKSWVLRWWME